jgi:hypothetical protein
LRIPKIVKDITANVKYESYETATAFLKSSFEYIFFNKPEGATDMYTNDTWYFKIKVGEVQKHGTDNDKAKLPHNTTSNERHKTKQIIALRKHQRPTELSCLQLHHTLFARPAKARC